MRKYNKYMQKLGKAVCKQRKWHHMSQEELAFQCEMNQGYISDIENGKRQYKVITLVKIAKALDIKPSILFIMAEGGDVEKAVSAKEMTK